MSFPVLQDCQIFLFGSPFIDYPFIRRPSPKAVGARKERVLAPSHTNNCSFLWLWCTWRSCPWERQLSGMAHACVHYTFWHKTWRPCNLGCRLAKRIQTLRQSHSERERTRESQSTTGLRNLSFRLLGTRSSRHILFPFCSNRARVKVATADVSLDCQLQRWRGRRRLDQAKEAQGMILLDKHVADEVPIKVGFRGISLYDVSAGFESHGALCRKYSPYNFIFH